MATATGDSYQGFYHAGTGLSFTRVRFGTDFGNTPFDSLGYTEASAAGYANGTFSGQSIDSTAILIRYTLAGDSNVNGTVDLTDFTYLAANFNKSSGAIWLEGDYNYDDKVDLTDFTFLASNFNQSLSAAGGVSATGLGSVVPEPSSLALLAGAGALLIRRRRPRAALSV